MRFLKKFTAALTAFSMFTVANFGALPSGAFVSGESKFSPDGGFSVSEIESSPVKPVITATKKVITLDEAKAMQTIEISVSGARAKYASTSMHIYYDKGLQIEMDEFGDPVASLGDAGRELTTRVPNIDPTAADFDMEGFYVVTAGNANDGLDGVLFKFNVAIENPCAGAVYPIDIIYRSSATCEDLFINKERDEKGKLMQAYTWTQGIYNKEYNNNFTANPEDIEKCSALADIDRSFDGYIAIADAQEAPPEPETALSGDANNDGFIDLKDVIFIRRYIAGGWSVELDVDTADVNNDGAVDLKDVILIRRYIAGGWSVELI